MGNRFYALLALSFILTTQGFSQKFIYNVENFTYFDNKVVFAPEQVRGMWFENRLTALAGIGLGEENDSQHSLYAGLSYTQPFGDNYQEYKLRPMVYYNFQRDGLSIYFGILPYSRMLCSLPSVMRTGSAEYVMPNLSGFLVQYSYDGGSVEALADWRQLRNQFQGNRYGVALVGKQSIYDGKVSARFNYSAHFEEMECPDTTFGGADLFGLRAQNLRVLPSVTVDFAKNTQFSNLSLSLGYLFSYQNHKYLAKNYTAHALTLDAQITWKMLTLKHSLYYSNRTTMPLYSFAEIDGLTIGDSNYRFNLYNKTELAVNIVKTNHFKLNAHLIMHAIENYRVGFQERLIATVVF